MIGLDIIVGQEHLSKIRIMRKGKDKPPKFGDDVLACASHYLFDLKNVDDTKTKTPTQIRADLKEIGIGISNHDPFNYIIPMLIEKDWIHLSTPFDNSFVTEISTTFPSLERVAVTFTDYIDDLAYHAALVIRDILTATANGKDEDTVRVGFSGGNTTRKIFQKLVPLLVKSESQYTFPKEKTLACHALVAGFDNAAPGTDPSSFFTYLDDCPTPFKKEFFLLHAPAFVPTKALDTVTNFPAVSAAKEAADQLDLIVTSAASFIDRHSQLRKYYEGHYPDDFKKLGEAGCIGDLLWLPFNEEGPMDLSQYESRPVTLLELGDLPRRIRGHTKVIFAIGPCADPNNPCQQSKVPILEAILRLQNKNKKYITHLVTNQRTAREIISIMHTENWNSIGLQSSPPSR